MGYLGRRIGKSQTTGTNRTDGNSGGILDLFTNGYLQRTGNVYNAPGAVPPQGITATGGVINDYLDGSTVYRAHIFTSTGTFDVTALGDFGNTVEYLVIAGGGGAASGGAGAGGYRTNVPTSVAPPAHNTTSPFPVSVAAYPVTIGAGGNGVPNPSPGATIGGDSSFGPPSNPQRIISSGGGFSGSINANNANPGGSGGGSGRASTHESPGGTTITITGLPVSPTTQGNPGGRNEQDPNYNGGGGGGAGAPGGNASPGNTSTGIGGDGLRNAIAGPNYPIGTPGPGPTTGGWFAGGGGTGGDGGVSPAAPGGAGGGGAGAYSGNGTPGTFATGGGGGGGGEGRGGNGGSGIVVVRYQIAQLTAAQKATGGAISYYGGKTIHTFTTTGTLTFQPDWTAATVEYLVVAGGGSGGATTGGGAGGYITGTTPIGAFPQAAITVQVGAGGANITSTAPSPQGNNGTPSYFGTPLTAYGGGGGGGLGPVPTATGIPGGSGGGGARQSGGQPGGTGSRQTGTSTPTPITPQGNPGGTGMEGPQYGGGGGGGAGSAGGDAAPNNGAAPGGAGLQAPPTFQDPKSSVGAPGPGGGGYWFAGGGGGGYDAAGTPAPGPGPGGGPGGPYAGAGGGATSPTGPVALMDAKQNTGGGGGGSTSTPWVTTRISGNGGSGIVLIAYPS